MLGLATLQIGVALADEAVVKADNKDNFQAVVAAINQQMAPGGRWEFVGAGERATIQQRFHDMGRLFDKYGGLAQMDENAKSELAADQDAVNQILTQRDGNRKICTSEAPTGSNIPRTTCRTYAQTERERQDTQQFLQDHAETMQQQIGH